MSRGKSLLYKGNSFEPTCFHGDPWAEPGEEVLLLSVSDTMMACNFPLPTVLLPLPSIKAFLLQLTNSKKWMSSYLGLCRSKWGQRFLLHLIKSFGGEMWETAEIAKNDSDIKEYALLTFNHRPVHWKYQGQNFWALNRQNEIVLRKDGRLGTLGLLNQESPCSTHMEASRDDTAIVLWTELLLFWKHDKGKAAWKIGLQENGDEGRPRLEFPREGQVGEHWGKWSPTHRKEVGEKLCQMGINPHPGLSERGLRGRKVSVRSHRYQSSTEWIFSIK